VALRASSLSLTRPQYSSGGSEHILSKVPAAVAELNAALAGGNPEDIWKAEPCPVCKAHDLPIIRCVDCSDVLVHQVGHLRGDRLHEWAVAHLYRADSLVGA